MGMRAQIGAQSGARRAIPGDKWLWLLLVTIAGALAMLGPGRWSIDARLFGWKRVEAPPRRSDSNSL